MDFVALYKRLSFWIKDFFHGSPIGGPYKEIKWLSEHSFEEGRSLREKKLQNLLKFAQCNSSFYSSYSSLNLSDYPVLKKKDLIIHKSEIAVPIEKIPGQIGDLYIQRTSGSTGTPLAIPQDTLKRRRRIAELKYYGSQVGFKTHELLLHLRIWNKWQSKSLEQIRRENIIPFDITDMSEARIAELCTIIKSERVYALRGYASIIDAFGNYLQKNPQCLPSLKIIISVSETLTDETREKIKRYAKCEIISQYANEECGIIAQELPPSLESNNIMYFNNADYYFEVLKMDSDEPAEFGELGRIVMTDLHNYAFPIIRYDNGDAGILLPPNDISNGYPVLGKLYGRTTDICYSTTGQPISSMLLSRTFKHYDNLLQWQFIQREARLYSLLVKVKDNVENVDLYLKDGIKELHEALGNDAVLKVEVVDEIPLLPSGKRKAVINEWNNK